MSHHHPHHHPTDSGQAARRALRWALVLNGGFLVIELVGGLLTGSLALLSDAAHMVSDVGALLLALGASHLATRAATPDQSYGYLRAETLGALVNGLALLVACALIFETAVGRLLGGAPHVEAWPVLLLGVIGLTINLLSAWHLHRSASDNLNIRGALLHMLFDALGSVGAIIASVFLHFGFPAADAIVSLVIGVLVLYGTWGLIRDASRILLQFAPPGLEAEEIQAALLALDEIEDVHDLHVWSVDGQRAILSAHLVTAREAPCESIRCAAQHMLSERFSITHTTLQTESEDTCVHSSCPLWREEPERHAHRTH